VVTIIALIATPNLMGAPGIGGLEYATIEIGPTAYLLHGFPETHYCWHRVAPALLAEHTVVVCDLKGYGESRSVVGGPKGEGYSKRAMAAELVEQMERLGFERFAVVGHDRGGRVAYRMALDHPEAVDRLGVLNIIPTVDQFERMAAEPSPDYYPWFLLAQPPPFAERLVSASAEYFLRHTLDVGSGPRRDGETGRAESLTVRWPCGGNGPTTSREAHFPLVTSSRKRRQRPWPHRSGASCPGPRDPPCPSHSPAPSQPCERNTERHP
jgi:pimeloyl-ACP methyl ester carboxylesterase